MLIGNSNWKCCVVHMCLPTLPRWGKGKPGIEQADAVAVKYISDLIPSELDGIEETRGFRPLVKFGRYILSAHHKRQRLSSPSDLIDQ